MAGREHFSKIVENFQNRENYENFCLSVTRIVCCIQYVVFNRKISKVDFGKIPWLHFIRCYIQCNTIEILYELRVQSRLIVPVDLAFNNNGDIVYKSITEEFPKNSKIVL